MIAINSIIHVLLLAAMPPLLLGIINKTKAFFAGRVGPPILQAYYDLLKLFRKDTVASRSTTWVFFAGPVITAVAVAMAGLIMPMGRFASPIHFTGDLILFAYLLALGRFFTASAALDTGSAFEGMGAAREVTFACFAEPAMFLALLALARFSGSLSLTGMLQPLGLGTWATGGASLVLVVAALFMVLLAENCRIPFDDPNTHLELTMIHEVMVLDHSGPAFGVVLYGAAMKLFVLGALVVRILLPVSSGYLIIDWCAFVTAMLLLCVMIGVVESVMARLRLVNVPRLLIGACLLAGFGFLLQTRLHV